MPEPRRNRLSAAKAKAQPRKGPRKAELPEAETKGVVACPYCSSKEVIKKGQRRKKYERVQLYFCHRCGRKFTPLISKNRSYPLRVILDSLSLYNRFHSLRETAQTVSGTFGLAVNPQTISKWLVAFQENLPALKLRSALMAGYDGNRAFIESRLLHGQVYDFKCHQAKLAHLLGQPSADQSFVRLQEFLEKVPKDCPHELFRKLARSKTRSSQCRDLFNIDQVDIASRPRSSAIKNARFLLQAVGNNKLRHERLQEFMLSNDSATVAVEVPVVLRKKDFAFFKRQLNFDLPLDWKIPPAITGHIDFLQIRQGLIYILDFKPGAKKEKPVEQLTLYALALARLTGIRLYHFKCAWFDDSHYYEFYPLHVVHKLQPKRVR
jgi:transposase-like protein